MRIINVSPGIVLALAVALVAVGCAKDEEKKSTAENETKQKEKKTEKGRDADKKAVGTDKKAADHSGWWCTEHGIPEHLCSMCDENVAAECQKNDDWCKEHDRARSQCFKCEPKLKEKYAIMYRARYSKEPPPIEKN